MKQMPFPDTNYGKQNKQKQTLKPIIIRTLMQTRWTEVRAYQIPEVITKLRTIFHPLVCFVFVYLALLGEVGTRFHPCDDGLTNKRKKNEMVTLSLLNLAFLAVMINDIPPCSFSPLHSTLSTWAMSTWLMSSTCSLRMVPAQNRSTQINSPNISSPSKPLVSLDTTYEVNFTLSSLISAPTARCLGLV